MPIDETIDVPLEKGHIRIPNDLYGAIMMAPFAKLQLRIILMIIRLTMGWQTTVVRISQVQLAKMLSTPFTGGFRRALAELTDAGIVQIMTPPKSHMAQTLVLQTDFTKWGRFSVSPSQLAPLSKRPPRAPQHSIPETVSHTEHDTLHALPRTYTGAESALLPASRGSRTPAPEGHEEVPLGDTKSLPITLEENELHGPKDKTYMKDSVTRIKTLAFRDGRLLLPPGGGAKYLHQTWTKRMGQVSLKSFATILHPVVTEWGVLPTRRGMELFITERTTLGKGAKLDWFVEQAVPYITRAHQIPAEYDSAIAASSSLELIEEARTAFWATLAAQDAQETALWGIAV